RGRAQAHAQMGRPRRIRRQPRATRRLAAARIATRRAHRDERLIASVAPAIDCDQKKAPRDGRPLRAIAATNQSSIADHETTRRQSNRALDDDASATPPSICSGAQAMPSNPSQKMRSSPAALTVSTALAGDALLPASVCSAPAASVFVYVLADAAS